VEKFTINGKPPSPQFWRLSENQKKYMEFLRKNVLAKKIQGPVAANEEFYRVSFVDFYQSGGSAIAKLLWH